MIHNPWSFKNWLFKKYKWWPGTSSYFLSVPNQELSNFYWNCIAINSNIALFKLDHSLIILVENFFASISRTRNLC